MSYSTLRVIMPLNHMFVGSHLKTWHKGLCKLQKAWRADILPLIPCLQCFNEFIIITNPVTRMLSIKQVIILKITYFTQNVKKCIFILIKTYCRSTYFRSIKMSLYLKQIKFNFVILQSFSIHNSRTLVKYLAWI